MNSQQIAIVITDGEQTTTGGFTPLDEQSKGLKDKGVTVYSLGVGSRVDPEQLRQIASSGDNVFTSAGFEELVSVVKPIVEKSCPSTPTPSPTPGKRCQLVLSELVTTVDVAMQLMAMFAYVGDMESTVT